MTDLLSQLDHTTIDVNIRQCFYYRGDLAMTDRKTMLTDAKIRASVIKLVYYEKVEIPTQIYEVISREENFLFQCLFEWLENKLDYNVTIHNFGLRELASAGSTWPAFRRHFTNEDATAAKFLIESYFSRELGTEDFPLYDMRTNCVGVHYAPDWIVIT